MERTLTDLSEDYFKEAAHFDELIEKCDREIQDARRKNQIHRYYSLKKKRSVFRSQKFELMETAYILKNYYDN